jgi:thiosulfate/3-mercaptopyruvate sulfurtransferase
VTHVEIDELARRLGDVVLFDVRGSGEYSGATGYACDPRQGHIPGARNLDVSQLMEAGSVEAIRALVGQPEGTEVIVYCHSGGRSEVAAQILAGAGYDARNYSGSWHEWSRRDDLPAER